MRPVRFSKHNRCYQMCEMPLEHIVRHNRCYQKCEAHDVKRNREEQTVLVVSKALVLVCYCVSVSVGC